jgi:hypothetical protein
VLFSQLPDPLLAGIRSQPVDFQTADDFVISSDGIVKSIRWWGLYTSDPHPAPEDTFSIRFFGDDAGQPANAPFVDVTPVGPQRTLAGFTDFFGRTVYEYLAILPTPVELSGGETYYLSIINDPSADVWQWHRSSDDGTGFARFDASSSWGPINENVAFQLIPEPTTFWLLGLGLAGLAVARRRKLN